MLATVHFNAFTAVRQWQMENLIDGFDEMCGTVKN